MDSFIRLRGGFYELCDDGRLGGKEKATTRIVYQNCAPKQV